MAGGVENRTQGILVDFWWKLWGMGPGTKPRFWRIFDIFADFLKKLFAGWKFCGNVAAVRQVKAPAGWWQVKLKRIVQ